jgi:hypothetical protein
VFQCTEELFSWGISDCGQGRKDLRCELFLKKELCVEWCVCVRGEFRATMREMKKEKARYKINITESKRPISPIP